MSSQSPASVLYSSDGTELAVLPNTPIPVGTHAILVDGYDSGGNARTLLTDVNGRLIVNQGAPNTLINAWPVELTDGYGNLFGEPNNPIWVTGSISVANPSVGPTAAPPPADATYIGALVTTAMESGLTNGDMYPFNLTTTGLLRIDGAYPSGTATATAVDMVQTGGLATTAAPTYTTATLNPLSLTTSGLLRVDGTGGVFNNQSVGADAAAALAFDTQVGGKVTTAAPTYTTGNLDALSLTTLGGLRIDGVYVVGSTNATAADVMNVGGYVTTAAPTYTTGQLNPLSLDTAGNLRVTGFVTTNKASTSAITSVAGSTSNTTILAANANRVFASIYNGTNKNMYVLLSASAASTSNYSILLITGSYWEVPNDWTGGIQAVWANGVSGNALVTQLTP